MAGLGRRSLLPSIPETILNSSNSADSSARRKAVEAAIMPQVCPSSPDNSSLWQRNSILTHTNCQMSLSVDVRMVSSNELDFSHCVMLRRGVLRAL